MVKKKKKKKKKTTHTKKDFTQGTIAIGEKRHGLSSNYQNKWEFVGEEQSGVKRWKITQRKCQGEGGLWLK